MMNSGDTAWVLISSAMVLLMTLGLAFFYGGLARRKNVLSIIMQCFIIMCIISLQWTLFGYSLAFGPDAGWGIIGNLAWIGLRGVGVTPNADYAATIPHQVFMIFQAMFAVITPALIIGAFAERIKFSAFLLFTFLWSSLVYDPLAHWVWGTGGWLRNIGALDFAGGIVVHVSSGVSALMMCILIGKRINSDRQAYRPHNLPSTVLGAGLLWFGWFGFNAGSALSAGSLAATAFVTTNTASAAAGLTWAIIEWWKHGAPTLLGTVTGAVAGMVAITPACGFVSPINAILIGIMVSIFCFYAITGIKSRFEYDDALDVFGIHGVGGIWGTIATGIFADKSINSAGADGLILGGTHQFLVQLLLVFIAVIYAVIMTWMIFKITDYLAGVRVAKKDELIGLDLTQHNESAYTVLE